MTSVEHVGKAMCCSIWDRRADGIEGVWAREVCSWEGNEGEPRTLERVSTSLSGKCISKLTMSPFVYLKAFKDSYHLSKPWSWEPSHHKNLEQNMAVSLLKSVVSTSWPVVGTKMSVDSTEKGRCGFVNISHSVCSFLISDPFLWRCEVYMQ